MAAKAPSPAHRAFWEGFEASCGGERLSRFYEAFHFADSEASANSLAELVLRGIKRATAGLVWSFEAADLPLLEPGNLSIVTNWAGEPQCVVETTAVAVVPYQDVSAEFASIEGEGDGSLEYWRAAHWAYFGRECVRIGKQPSLTMPVACEQFKVIYRSQQERAIHEEVRLAPYDPRWPTLFALERDRLLARFDRMLAVEHFGSTAVPGMPAKPVIDLLAGVESMAQADALFEPILASGYTTSRKFNATLADRRWFMRSSDGHRTHHLHVVIHEGPVWCERLRFRDLLRSSSSLAKSYAELKSALAGRFGHDREAYTNAKAEFVARALAVA